MQISVLNNNLLRYLHFVFPSFNKSNVNEQKCPINLKDCVNLFRLLEQFDFQTDWSAETDVSLSV